MRTDGRRLRAAVALGGAAIGLAGVAGALAGEGPAPRWVLRLFAAWCVATPYWWYIEYRLFMPAEAGARQAFEAGQSQSRWVWLGFTLAMGVLILASAP
ncbi:hypothetical protein ACLF3G_29165 [Falsiroseomonas sp. HC035]|uniref:hypothetical protein n=1 Tax=Falsiroseomonas sp. HC035 TaxID=3390999 RepID=UPI003D31AEDA